MTQQHPFLVRMGAWLVGGLVSLVLAVALSLSVIVVAALGTRIVGQGLFGAGVGVFIAAVVWPGLLTASLVFFDGLVLDGVSRHLFLRAIAWGLIPILFIFVLSRFGIHWVRVSAVAGGNGIGIILCLAVFVTPSLIAACLGVLLQSCVRRRSI